jgi:hypothetical protein
LLALLRLAAEADTALLESDCHEMATLVMQSVLRGLRYTPISDFSPTLTSIGTVMLEAPGGANV